LKSGCGTSVRSIGSDSIRELDLICDKAEFGSRRHHSRHPFDLQRGDATMGSIDLQPVIPGTTLFDSTQARKGYALNKM
jgi:hypothetical protein